MSGASWHRGRAGISSAIQKPLIRESSGLTQISLPGLWIPPQMSGMILLPRSSAIVRNMCFDVERKFPALARISSALKMKIVTVPEPCSASTNCWKFMRRKLLWIIYTRQAFHHTYSQNVVSEHVGSTNLNPHNILPQMCKNRRILEQRTVVTNWQPSSMPTCIRTYDSEALRILTTLQTLEQG